MDEQNKVGFLPLSSELFVGRTNPLQENSVPKESMTNAWKRRRQRKLKFNRGERKQYHKKSY